MPTTTSYNFGDVVLVPFPFTDQTTTKKRPAVVVSSAAYQGARSDLIVMAVTGQIRFPTGFGEVMIDEWKKAGLLKPFVIKPVLTTIEKTLVLRWLGQLEPQDQTTLRAALRVILG
jgi:mRNA interferase MazF